MRRGIMALGLLMLLAACAQQDTGASFGDTVLVNYVGEFQNGTVFDTNMQSVAAANNIQKQSFEPLRVTIGKRQVIPGFEAALIGMKEGQQKAVEIPPAQAYGRMNPTKRIKIAIEESVNRTATLDRQVTIPAQNLAQLPGENNIGDVVEVSDIQYEVLEKGNETATLRIDVEEGDQIRLPNTLWNSTVVEVTDENYVVRQDPEQGSLVRTPFGPAMIMVSEDRLTRVLQIEEGGTIQSQSGAGRVVSVNETQAVIDFNHPLAGQTLTFDIEVVGIV